ncbi:LOW QUALITY PROTEIN: ferritin light chain, oocyte isoform-like [Sceloporus undulatus]|uniref:LOW QUALITY PROTEIN: ferritin light chain, oocyte isoform-like n=1 Tax=Sceloporus undulatus TaxID=8520 RepID=UPI001C4CD1D6|nr:LOW QUALITY PROTEIN: ferritin light chain, oocyte isoform-like [Sceloporus undulatus]
MSSQIHQNYHTKSEARVNHLVNQSPHASYKYLSLGLYFNQDDVPLTKFFSFFHHLSEEKHEQAEKFLTFQSLHGGRVVLQGIKKPEQDEWKNRAVTMEVALNLEKSVNQALLDLHQVACCHTDPHLCDFLETHYLDEELKLVKVLGDHMTNLKHVHASEEDLDEYLFDLLALGKSSD